MSRNTCIKSINIHYTLYTYMYIKYTQFTIEQHVNSHIPVQTVLTTAYSDGILIMKKAKRDLFSE